MVDEIVLPETKPETEWVRGRALQKVSPTRAHARIQGELYAALEAWAHGRGDVGTEWRFRVAPPGEIRRPLVPDVAYLSYARSESLSDAECEVPALAPDVAIEILSLDDRPADVAAKIDTYVRAGASLVVVVDGGARNVVLHDRVGSRTIASPGFVRHEALPGFELDLAAFFSRALDRRR